MARRISAWLRGMLDYISNNEDNVYTDDLSHDDKIIIYKDEAGVDQYDRVVSFKDLLNTGELNLSNLPTSASGLSAGDVWQDSGTLKIVT